jgi:hypothetical protein
MGSDQECGNPHELQAIGSLSPQGCNFGWLKMYLLAQRVDMFSSG